MIISPVAGPSKFSSISSDSEHWGRAEGACLLAKAGSAPKLALRYPKPDDNVFINCFRFVHKFEIALEIVPRCSQNERKMHTN